MRIRVEILETEPFVKDGTYVFNTGDIDGRNLAKVMDEISWYLLSSLDAMRHLEVHAPGS